MASSIVNGVGPCFWIILDGDFGSRRRRLRRGEPVDRSEIVFPNRMFRFLMFSVMLYPVSEDVKSEEYMELLLLLFVLLLSLSLLVKSSETAALLP
jgi:hypothetical protein